LARALSVVNIHLMRAPVAFRCCSHAAISLMRCLGSSILRRGHAIKTVRGQPGADSFVEFAADRAVGARRPQRFGSADCQRVSDLQRVVETFPTAIADPRPGGAKHRGRCEAWSRR